MKYDDLVVDGETEDGKGRKLVAGLRLLRAYGKIAERALKHIASGKDVDMIVPFLEAFGDKYKNHYTVTIVPVHTECKIPPLPDYSDLRLHLERLKPSPKSPLSPSPKKGDEERARGYMLHVRGHAIGVHPHGKVCEIACDEVVGSAWFTKTRVSWNFRSMSDVKSGKHEVCKAIADVVSGHLVKLCSNGSREVWHSQASHVREVLRNRCRAVLMADGHAERIREEVVRTMTVESVHSL